MVFISLHFLSKQDGQDKQDKNDRCDEAGDRVGRPYYSSKQGLPKVHHGLVIHLDFTIHGKLLKYLAMKAIKLGEIIVAGLRSLDSGARRAKKRSPIFAVRPFQVFGLRRAHS
jgi:hypothetical protein